MMRLKFPPAVCLAFAIFALIFPSSALAGCTGSSPTWTSSPDQASVQSCINNAANGDTVNVSAGSATWTSVSWSGKNINLIGAGASSVTIALNSVMAIDSSTFRLSGFTFNEGSGDYIQVSNSAGWRIDHNTITRTNWDICILGYGGQKTAIEGLIDHNTVTYGRVDIQGEDTSRGGRDLWAAPLNMGTVHAVYVEDNNVLFPDGSSGGSYGNFTDGNLGCRLVVRFNTMLGTRFESHGVQGENQDGCMLFEYYNNTLTNPSTPNYRPFFIRGGTGVVFHNTSDGKYLNNAIDIDGPRLSEDSISSQVPNWQYCDGTSKSSYLSSPGTLSSLTSYATNKSVIVDGSGTGGYPCRDQIGTSTNASLWNYDSAVPTQTLMPAYFWRNTQPSGEIPVSVVCETAGDNLCTNQDNNLIVQNRDYFTFSSSFNGSSGVGEGTLANRPSSCTKGVAYWATDQGSWNQSGNSAGQGQMYKCTATNTWTLYYTPFTYPHPLQSGTQSSPPPSNPPPAPTNLSDTVL